MSWRPRGSIASSTIAISSPSGGNRNCMRQHSELWQTLHTAHEPAGGHDDLRPVASSICQTFQRRNCQIFGQP